jgi:alkaline phosphatase
MTRIAVASLNYNINGYFLVVEDSRVARSAEQNLGKLAMSEVAEVDEAIQTAVDYAGPDALVLVTNNYSLGATGPLPTPATSDLVAPVPTLNADKPSPKGTTPASAPPAPSPVWLTGPGGPVTTKPQAELLRQRYDEGLFSTNAPGLLQPQPAFRFQAQASPTAEPAWIASRGEGSTQFRGFFNNTDVYDIVLEQF